MEFCSGWKPTFHPRRKLRSCQSCIFAQLLGAGARWKVAFHHQRQDMRCPQRQDMSSKERHVLLSSKTRHVLSSKTRHALSSKTRHVLSSKARHLLSSKTRHVLSSKTTHVWSLNTAHVWLAKSTEIYYFGYEWGPHGSPRAHIKSGRSHKPRERF